MGAVCTAQRLTGLVCADEEHRWVLFKDVLRPVAVVNLEAGGRKGASGTQYRLGCVCGERTAASPWPNKQRRPARSCHQHAVLYVVFGCSHRNRK